MPCHGKSTVNVDNMPRHGDVTMPRHDNVTVDDTAAKVLSNSTAVSPQQSNAAKRVSEAGGPKINIGD